MSDVDNDFFGKPGPVIGETVTAPLKPATIPRSTLNFDEPSEAVGRAVNEDDKPNAETLYHRCIMEMGITTVIDVNMLAPGVLACIRRAIFDAYTLGGQAAKLEAETKHTALAQRSLEARLAVLMPTCITVAMDAAGLAKLFVSNDDILTVRDRYALTTDVQEAGIEYSLIVKDGDHGA